jgi:hypothetical protein
VTTVTDDFSGTLAAWTQLIGSWAIVSGKCRCTTVGGTFGYYCRYDTDVGAADMYAQAVTSSSQADAFDNTGVLVRGATGATQQSYQFATNHNSNTASFWRLVPGTETQLKLAGNATTGAAELSTPIASGDTLRLEITGSLLRGKVNGALVACTRDTTITTGQRGGLNAYNNTAAHFSEHDNFQAGLLDDLLAPYVAGISVQVAGTGTTLTPTVPLGLVAGDCLTAWVTSKDAAQTVTAPPGEGWSLIQNPSQTGLEGYLFAKVWGLGGQTDDTTPTFSIGSGTAGWVLALENVRNPAHATAPWTSVAAAIVASGSQSNASSTTVTAPSVTDTGTHHTIGRYYGAADDNILGLSSSATTNSEGALVYGGADYDQTTGGGIAQAMSIREDVTTAGSTGTATVTETAVGPDISNGVTVVFAIPATAVDLVVADAAQGQAADAPALTQVHEVAAAGAAQAQSADGVVVSQAHSVLVADAAQGHTSGSPALTQTHAMVANDATQAQDAETTALTQDHNLVAADATQAQAAAGVTVTQDHQLAANDAAQGHAADQPTITVDPIDLVVADATHTHASDTPALTQAHELATADANQAQTADTPTLAQVHALVPADASQAQAAQAVDVVQAHELVVDDATQAQDAEAPTLGQSQVLVADDASQDHVAESPALGQAHDIEAAGATQAQAADQVELAQAHDLAVDHGTQAQTAGTVTLTVGGVNLIPGDATQAQAADAPALTQQHALTVDDAGQAQHAGSPALAQAHALDVAGATQAQTVDSPTPTQAHELVVADAAHTQAADSVSLSIETVVLEVHDATLGQTADQPSIVQQHDLVVADATQAQAADDATLVVGLPPHTEPLTLTAVTDHHSLTAARDQTTLTALDDDYPLTAEPDQEHLTSVDSPLTLKALEV